MIGVEERKVQSKSKINATDEVDAYKAGGDEPKSKGEDVPTKILIEGKESGEIEEVPEKKGLIEEKKDSTIISANLKGKNNTAEAEKCRAPSQTLKIEREKSDHMQSVATTQPKSQVTIGTIKKALIKAGQLIDIIEKNEKGNDEMQQASRQIKIDLRTNLINLMFELDIMVPEKFKKNLPFNMTETGLNIAQLVAIAPIFDFLNGRRPHNLDVRYNIVMNRIKLLNLIKNLVNMNYYSYNESKFLAILRSKMDNDQFVSPVLGIKKPDFNNKIQLIDLVNCIIKHYQTIDILAIGNRFMFYDRYDGNYSDRYLYRLWIGDKFILF